MSYSTPLISEDSGSLQNIPGKTFCTKRNKIIVAGVVISLVIIAAVLIILKVIKKNRNDDDYAPNEFKLQTVPMPSYVYWPEYAHYTPSGRIVFQYTHKETNKKYVAIMDDDGKNIQTLYDGEVKPFYNNTNGVRLMPFADNKRLLLGDGIMECEPSLDEVTDPSKQTKIIPVEYPEQLLDLQGTYLLWSEIIPSPDNVHMGWSTLHLTAGSIAFQSRLERKILTPEEQEIPPKYMNLSVNHNVPKDVRYVMTNVLIISDLNYNYEDPDHPGQVIINDYIHGGEIKQYTPSGQQITFVGASLRGMPRSTLQNLADEIVTPITHEAGYDETTIISPNEQFGTVMTTRFSPQSSFAILGLVSRPYSALTLNSAAQSTYMYAVACARNGNHSGNIGPALIVLEDSLKDTDFDRKYHGFDLHDKTEIYVYNSPMSWHYSSLKAIWLETSKPSYFDGKRDMRIRQVVLNDDVFHAKPKVNCTKESPDNIPYAQDLSALNNITAPVLSGTINSKQSGSIALEYSLLHSNMTYSSFVDENNLVYEGYDSHSLDFETRKSSYESKLKVYKANGQSKTPVAENNFKLTFDPTTYSLIKNETSGYATYNGETLKVENMEYW